jgi:hypothetical protein
MTFINFSTSKPYRNSSGLRNIWSTKGSASSLWTRTSQKVGPSPSKTKQSANNSKGNTQRRLPFIIEAKFRSTRSSPESRKTLRVFKTSATLIHLPFAPKRQQVQLVARHAECVTRASQSPAALTVAPQRPPTCSTYHDQGIVIARSSYRKRQQKERE